VSEQNEERLEAVPAGAELDAAQAEAEGYDLPDPGEDLQVEPAFDDLPEWPRTRYTLVDKDVASHFDLHYDEKRVGLVWYTSSRSEYEASVRGISLHPLEMRMRCEPWLLRSSAMVRDITWMLYELGICDTLYASPVVAIDIASKSPVAWFETDTGPYHGFIVRPDNVFLGGRCETCTPCRSIQTARDQSADSWVYFVRAGATGPIKIGRSNNVDGRVSTLQTGNHEPLQVIAKIPGGQAVEAMLHTALEPHALRGEWFKAAPEVLRLIDELRGRR
jgi:hypothetical protein